jgi:hypothetical protein
VRPELSPGKVLSVMAYPLNGDPVDWARGIDLRDHVGTVLITDSYRETGLTQCNQKNLLRYLSSCACTALLDTAFRHLGRVE